VTPRPTLGQVLRPFLASSAAADLRLSPHQWKTLRALAACRTGALGGQAYFCPHCRREHVVAHSCRNRHCPHCQGAAARDWLAQQAATLLPVPYFHLVFTLPHALNGLIRQNRAALFKLLFDAASQTLLEFGAERLEAQLGITAVLHPWSQTLGDHYHLHGIVTGGGVAHDQSRWVATAPHYLFPVRALSRKFRGKYLAGLNALFTAGKLEFHGELNATATTAKFAALLRQAARPEWVVYAKRPFAGPEQVLAYLSRYTHRVAISPRRLLATDGQSVTFAYKDYADGSRPKTMTLATAEFVRRFCRHVLPERFVKIRHYGLLGNRRKQARLARARELLGAAPIPEQPPPPPPLPELLRAPVTKREPASCPFCQRPGLVKVREVPPQAVARFDSS
jgi:Putative transposase/Transposase zinc-binding domain